MSNLKPMDFADIESELISDDTNVGTCIGISNSKSHKWRLSIYIGSLYYHRNLDLKN